MLMDYFRFSLKTFGGRKLRTGLTILGIFIGIAAVVSLISLGQGMQNAIDEQFEMLGSNRITVTPGGGDMSSPMTAGLVAAKLYDHDVEVIRKVKGVDYAIGVLVRTAKVEYRGKSRYTMLFASSTDSKSIRFIQDIDYFMIEEGRYPKESEKYKVSLGSDMGESLFDRKIRLGEKITISGRNFEVVAINKKSGNPAHDTKVSIPLKTAREVFDVEKELSLIFVETSPGFEPAQVAQNIEDALRRDHRVKKGEEDFTVSTAEQMIASFKGMLGIVQAFLVGIAFISLLVGGVGIMNTMYTSVLERTREIGIMKSIGARNIDIMAIFVIESGLLGLVGGVIGVVIGYGIGKAAEMIAVSSGVTILKVFFSAELIGGALLFSFMVGSISGLLPAIEASGKNPVDSLRYRR
ncbi:MAG: ABC transporter permease [archaeon]|nr:ABC transporter permease [archaeon]